MTKAFGRFVVLVVTTVGMTTAALGVPAQMMLRVVEKNGTKISPPSITVDVLPGDQITVEACIVGWNDPGVAGNELIESYQIRIDSLSYQNGVSGALIPVSTPTPEDNAFINKIRADYVFGTPGKLCSVTGTVCALNTDCPTGETCVSVSGCPLSVVEQVDTSTPDYRYASLVIQGTGCIDTTQCKYMGTLKIDISDFNESVCSLDRRHCTVALDCPPFGEFQEPQTCDLVGEARDTFTLSMRTHPESYYCITSDLQCELNPHPIVYVPLTIRGPGPICIPEDAQVIAVNPPSCSLDARQPTNLDGSNPLGFKVFTFTFNDQCHINGAIEEDVAVREVPSGGGVPFVTSVAVNGTDLTVTLNARIDPGKWTCIEHVPTGIEKCWASLPADASGDRNATAGDIITLINHLNNVGTPLPIERCDMDRSGGCGAPDIIRLIDLLNGASEFVPWLGVSIPACPSP